MKKFLFMLAICSLALIPSTFLVHWRSFVNVSCISNRFPDGNDDLQT